MRQDLHLFISGKEVDFNSDPKILFNFKETELTNPTIVKNSWSKTVTINSTPNNDDIFNHFWNLERNQAGVSFNAMIKNPFELYVNNALIQNGYCKLDNVKMSNHQVQYQVSLFGGLGDFFYNLSYNQGQATDERKTLASLSFTTDEYDSEPQLDFVINRNTIDEAWKAINGNGSIIPDDKWRVINFAPCYNGIPSDFDANKVLINYRGQNLGIFYRNWNDGDSWDTSDHHYQPVIGGVKNMSGYSVGEASEELTSDETFDLRSYLQRPVVNVNRVLQACFQPQNNGGYQVKLDTHFFNYDNPYWTDGWCTLPMLRDLDVEGGQTSEITGATVDDVSLNRKNIVFDTQSLMEMDNVRLRINVGFNINSSYNTLYSYFHFFSSDACGFNCSDKIRDFEYNCGVIVQMVARDVNGAVCAVSKAYCLSTYQYYPEHYGGNIWDDFPYDPFDLNGYPASTDMQFLQGCWKKIDGQFVFCNMQGNPVDIEFTFPGAAPISSIELLTQMNEGNYHKDKNTLGPIWRPGGGKKEPNASFVRLWDSQGFTGGIYELSDLYSHSMTGTPIYRITDFYAVATDFEGLFSETYIPKEKVLSTSYTPAEFLISYAKMFGLYFYRDPAEVADNPTLYPKGVIHIMDRDTFYTDEYVNLQDRIDRSKDMTITPSMAGSKWYSFEQEPIDSDAGNAYKNTYGQTYGRQVVNTGYNFDNNTTNLYDGTVFKSGVMVREKDKYFAMPYYGVPVFCYNGFKYTLYDPSSGGTIDSYELEVPVKVINKTDINNLDLNGYDSMSKLQCHSDHNEAVDGDGVLLFYRGYVQTPNDYWLTDDVLEMQTLNGGNACWLMPGSGIDALGHEIAIKTHILPHFTRDLVNFGLQEGNIVNSWNFGHPQVTFVPNTFTTDWDCIYDKCWKNYINDMYNVNGKILTCYVNLKGFPTNEWLRKWYWFDNSIWRLNEIKDYNAADPSTTQCTFIKVQNVNNYKLDEITNAGNESIILDSNTVPYEGGTISGRVILQSGGQWFSGDDDGLITGYDVYGNSYYARGAVQPLRGSGEITNITVTFPPSSAETNITWNICVEDDYDNFICTTVTQYGKTPFIKFIETGATISTAAGTYTFPFRWYDINPNTFHAEAVTVFNWVSDVSVDPVNNTLSVTVTDNQGDEDRQVVIEIYATGNDGGRYSDTIRITQTGTGAEVWPSTLTFDYWDEYGDDERILVNTENEITITINDVYN